MAALCRLHRPERPGGVLACWLGSKSFGYGYFYLKRKRIRAHRLAYETLVEAIPDGLCSTTCAVIVPASTPTTWSP